MSISRSERIRLAALTGALIASIALAVGVTNAVHGDAVTPTGPAGTMAVSGYPTGSVFAAPGTTAKQAMVTQALRQQPTATPKPGAILTLNHDEWLYADGSKAISPGGKAGQIMVSGRTFAQVPFWDIGKNHATYSESNSLVAWMGTSPVDADAITQTDNWITSTYGGSTPTVTGSPSGAAVVAPGSLVFKSQVARTWMSLHSWNGSVSVSTTGVVYDVGYQVTGTFQFGSSFFTVSGQDAAGV